MCDATNLALVFYPGRLKVKRWDISGWPMEILPKIKVSPIVKTKILKLIVNQIMPFLLIDSRAEATTAAVRSAVHP
jgi:hypothetical protein